jgi:flagellin
MALNLNTNIDSLTAQNNLSGSQALLSQSLTRLSSGLRINSAADDAAGLAISQQFTTQVNGTNQAISNANDAVSESQTAGGALSTIINNLQSIRTLALEAANGSNSASDRQALDSQVQQQISEITQIAQQTQFNGLSVLNGSSGTQTYQVGANVGDTISIDLAQGVGASQIGQTANYAPAAVTTSAVTTGSGGALTIQVGSNAAVSIGASSSYATGVAWQQGDSAFAKSAAINAAGISGLTSTANTTVTDGAFTGISNTTGASINYLLSINGQQILNQSVAATTGTISNTAIVAAINQYSTQDGGVTATLNSANALVLNAADGSNIAISQTSTGLTGGLSTAVAGTAAGGGLTNRGNISLTAGANITVGGTSTADIAALGFAAGTTPLTAGSTLAQQNVKTVAAANATIESVDSALATVSAFQSQLGAIQNRFTAAVGNLTSTAQNLTQSRSTIQDANFAQETANLTQAQVLEQAGISVLAQANQEPQLILKLLQ